MTEKSYYWDGLITGDATLAPYTEIVYHEQWYKMFSRYNHGGIIEGYLSELSVVGTAGGVQIGSGAAIVDGWFYENTTALTKTIDAPSSNPRIDVIVARMDISKQTVRITIVEGTEGATPSVPTISELHGIIWDMKLAEVYIDTSGNITVTAYRKYCVSPLAELGTWVKIAEYEVASGFTDEFTLEDVPQIYRDIKVVGQWTSTIQTAQSIAVELNDNPDGNDNKFEDIYGNGAAIGAQASSTIGAFLIRLYATGMASEEAVSFDFVVMNYSKENFYKTLLNMQTFAQSGSGIFHVATTGSLFLETDPITRIQMAPINNSLAEGSIVTIYGRGFSKY